MKKKLFLLLFALSLAVVKAQTVESYPLNQVHLSEGTRWRHNQQLDSAWICSLPVNRLMHSFRTTAGEFSAYEGGYSGKTKIAKLGGWESLDCDLRGHAVGHLLSAYALMYANTGSDIFRAKGDSIVEAIRQCQQTTGTGYMAAFPDGLLKRNLRGQSVWAPWYTIHKILAGLVQQYRLTGNETALAICRDFTKWADAFLSNDNLQQYIDDKAPTVEAVRQRAIRNEFGGIGEAFYDIYLLTGDKAALRVKDFFYHNEKLDKLYTGDFDMGTMHCNTFLPKVIAEARSSQRGASMAADFWHSIVSNHVLAPGCLSDKEHFFAPAETSKHLTGNTGETCCTYNMLRLTRELYALNPKDAAYFDYYERALYNHILGQQDPETGMVHYFLPTQTGAYKLYSTYDRSFWCCVGSSFESHAKYAESIYWHSNDTVYINLFIPSHLTASDIDITMRTDFPYSSGVSLQVNAKRNMTLLIRQPSWTGKSGYRAYKIKKGERKIDFSLPMKLHTEATPDDPSRIALFYGPILMVGQLGTEGMNCWSNPDVHNDYYGYDYNIPEAIRSVSLDVRTLKNTAPLQWKTTDGITIKPLFDTHRQRYVTYWNKNNY